MMKVDTEKCIGCGQCVKDCFPMDIEIVEGKAKINNKVCIKCGHCIAVCPKDAVSTDEYNMEDVKDYNKENFSINPDTLLNFIKFRRTVRQFKNKEVEEEKIIKIIESGRFTQTGSNMQDVSYIVVKEELEKLKNLTFETLKNMGEYVLNNRTPETRIYRRYGKMWIEMYEEYKKNPKNDKIFFNAPVIIVVTANSQVDGALASSNMELMADALGLGTFFSGFFVRAAQENKDIVDFLGVKRRKEIVTCMILGYPDVKYLRTVPRKEVDISWK
ncbi:nitroreductase [Clostridium pasteurianum DSM 525 = ATCC 6013]|uniref:Nitroreductase n=1 Tax=Clostridium pasteurianum DSM 525 = ATCC 6013 TaxID=1262449 RepID=A0A0H3J1H8_CLOPA|nr:nitroreductase family protein [Clostridium pasteurianum]AJA47239.1 nitroreductase [Clostridium pasteurianum DSM 525 = ATCC 6013]AJA51227.1 nitroreductase [Clostridium pasteurianum DSM 525 = ATCC 6013]AOZ74590.1 nitroreductase [Clostridium pasteurianum DSM 525 = ATCC 6013]AOZ78387.1 nitroreductase [Clostridium pasteurianum]ELP59377.1 nitroreductase [Clostridium pasteurianum DSM 525 = ATCC 6013]